MGIPSMEGLGVNFANAFFISNKAFAFGYELRPNIHEEALALFLSPSLFERIWIARNCEVGTRNLPRMVKALGWLGWMSVVTEVQVQVVLLKVPNLVVMKETEVSTVKVGGNDAYAGVVSKPVGRLSEVAVLAERREIVKFIGAPICQGADMVNFEGYLVLRASAH